MKTLKFRPCLLVLILFSLAALSGCSGPLALDYRPPKTNTKPLKTPVTVRVEPFADARKSLIDPKDPRVIGTISSTVSDMEDDHLRLSEDVAALVASAYAKELKLAGYTVKTDNSDKADITLAGEVKDLRLDIGSRDEISVEITVRFTEAKTGRIIWSGAVTEKGDRFAGVSGNSRRTISNYLTASLSKAIRGSLSEAGDKIAVRVGAAYAPQPGEEGIPEPLGRLNISSDPPRTKVYLNGVYYGTTPISIDIDPGVYDAALRQAGFKEGTEKVSVRKGRLTELEIILEKE